MKNSGALWFKAKRYGWGWYPSRWQGWAVLSACLIAGLLPLMIVSQLYADDEGCRRIASQGMSIACMSEGPGMRSLWISAIFCALSAFTVLSVVCFKKGEKPRWRWGN